MRWTISLVVTVELLQKSMKKPQQMHSPPLEESVNPALRFTTRGPFEEVHNDPPELYIVKVTIDRTPRGNRKKHKSHLPAQSPLMINQTNTIMMTYLTGDVYNGARSDFIHFDNLGHMRSPGNGGEIMAGQRDEPTPNFCPRKGLPPNFPDDQVYNMGGAFILSSAAPHRQGSILSALRTHS
jgi:hypothetical protein